MGNYNESELLTTIVSKAKCDLPYRPRPQDIVAVGFETTNAFMAPKLHFVSLTKTGESDSVVSSVKYAYQALEEKARQRLPMATSLDIFSEILESQDVRYRIEQLDPNPSSTPRRLVAYISDDVTALMY